MIKFDNILKIYGKDNRKIPDIKLTDLGNKLFGKSNWKFVNDYDSETETPDSGNWHKTTIGKFSLTDGCDNTEYNKAGYVLTVKEMYHEKQHVWHRTTAWNDKSGLISLKGYEQTTNIARREFVRGYFPSAYCNNYSNDPGEMDAERNGIKYAFIYFESDPVISKTEAEEILFQLMMSDNCVHKEILDEHRDKIKSIYDVLEIFENRADNTADIKYPVTIDISPKFKDESGIDLTLTHKFLYSEEYREYRKAFDKCKTGIEQDKVLEQVILFTYPNIIKKTPLRLREELLNCKRQMEIGSLRPGQHAIDPKHINYSIQTAQEAEVELTEEDLSSIPVGNDNLNL